MKVTVKKKVLRIPTEAEQIKGLTDYIDQQTKDLEYWKKFAADATLEKVSWESKFIEARNTNIRQSADVIEKDRKIEHLTENIEAQATRINNLQGVINELIDKNNALEAEKKELLEQAEKNRHSVIAGLRDMWR